METVQDIEGYSEAQEVEYQFRIECWLGQEEPICGLPMAALTLRRLLLLVAAGNPFVRDREDDFEWHPYHVAEFLWVCSPDFVEGPGKAAEKARKRFYRSIAKRIRFLEAVSPIRSYVDSSYFDLVAGPRDSARAPLTGWVASIVHRLASAYGWTVPQIFQMPVRQIWQLDRCQMASDPDLYNQLSNPISDRIAMADLERLNAPAVAKRKTR